MWPVNDATTLHLGSTDRALAGATGSLLLEGLAAGAGDLAAAKSAVRTLPGRSALGDNNLVDERHIGLNVEQFSGQLNAAGLIALHVENVK